MSTRHAKACATEACSTLKMTLLEKTIQEIRPIDPSWIEAAARRQLELTKPPGSLGRLEEIANRCAAIRETIELTAGHPRIVLFAGDHGVCAEGVSAYPQEVTAQMVANFLRGGAAINALARAGGLELKVVDVGVAAALASATRQATRSPAPHELISRRVGPGTRNFCEEPAMTEAEMNAALDTGIELARDAADEGCDLLGFGEMGIGNTTSASAIAAILTGRPVEAVVGRGTGADEECLARKRSAIERGLALHADRLYSQREMAGDKIAGPTEPAGDKIAGLTRERADEGVGRSPGGPPHIVKNWPGWQLAGDKIACPTEILQCVGGFEIAAMCGFCLGAASRRIPVLTDGFIATAAAALAVQLCPALSGYLFAAHRSTEPGHAHLLALIEQEPLLDLGMRLGEGTGVALAMKLMQAAIAAFTEMATFASAGVSNK
jgi:nicotinate-nucleotide--dimethylbenzimidazole phosphoribosyltransferase